MSVFQEKETNHLESIFDTKVDFSHLKSIMDKEDFNDLDAIICYLILDSKASNAPLKKIESVFKQDGQEIERLKIKQSTIISLLYKSRSR